MQFTIFIGFLWKEQRWIPEENPFVDEKYIIYCRYLVMYLYEVWSYINKITYCPIENTFICLYKSIYFLMYAAGNEICFIAEYYILCAYFMNGSWKIG